MGWRRGEAIGAPGLLGLRRLDKEVAAGALIGAGVTVFETAAAVMRSGKSNDDDMEAAKVLEKTGAFYRERVLPRAKTDTGKLRVRMVSSPEFFRCNVARRCNVRRATARGR